MPPIKIFQKSPLFVIFFSDAPAFLDISVNQFAVFWDDIYSLPSPWVADTVVILHAPQIH